MTAIQTEPMPERIPFPEMRRFSLDELEIACSDAFVSGRIYHAGGEKDKPDVAHRKMMYRALQAVRRHRRDPSRRRTIDAARIPPAIDRPTRGDRYEITAVGRAALDTPEPC